jgi:hypothetical protein
MTPDLALLTSARRLRVAHDTVVELLDGDSASVSAAIAECETAQREFSRCLRDAFARRDELLEVYFGMRCLILGTPDEPGQRMQQRLIELGHQARAGLQAAGLRHRECWGDARH